MAGKSAILAVKIIGDASNAIGSMGKAGLAVTGLGAAAVAGAAIVGKALYDIRRCRDRHGQHHPHRHRRNRRRADGDAGQCP